MVKIEVPRFSGVHLLVDMFGPDGRPGALTAEFNKVQDVEVLKPEL